MARLAGNVSDENLRSTILMGLEPDLKQHAIQVGPTSLNKLLRCVKKAEEANSIADPTRDSIAETLKRIEQKLSAGDPH